MNTIQIAVLVLGIAGLVSSTLLAFLNRRLKVEEDPLIEKVLDILPGLNCGVCKFTGCRAFAEAVVNKINVSGGCLPGGDEINKKINEVLGTSRCQSTKRQVAICCCGAKEEEKKSSPSYQGPRTCQAADITGGAIDCIYGCIGFGDCIEKCPSKALILKDKKVYVDFKKCTGCEKCERICPRSLLKLVPLKENIKVYYVACNSQEDALRVKKVCSRGCIGCSLCTKVADSPYYLKKNLSYVDYKKTAGEKLLEEGKNKCPTKCIFSEQTAIDNDRS